MRIVLCDSRDAYGEMQAFNKLKFYRYFVYQCGFKYMSYF